MVFDVPAIDAGENLNQHAYIKLPDHDSHTRASILDRLADTSFGIRLATAEGLRIRWIYVDSFMEGENCGKEANLLFLRLLQLAADPMHGTDVDSPPCE